MERRFAVVGAVLLLLSAAVVVQVLDPQFGEREPPGVNFSDPPNEVAADAAKQFEYVDYSYRIDILRNRSEGWQQVRTMQVDHSDREYYKTGPLGERGVVLYGTDAVAFVRAGANASWKVTHSEEVLYHPARVGNPFLVDRIRSSNASVESRNGSSLLINLNVHPLNVAEGTPGNATLRIDKESRLIKSVLVVYDTGSSRDIYLRFQHVESGTDVERPDKIHHSVKEILWDILRGSAVNIRS